MADDRALLAELEVATVRDGWKAVACVTKYERCFKRNGYFVSMVAVSDSRKPGVPGAYLSLRRTAPAMVAASVAQS